MASHKGRKAAGFRTKSGAVKVQVLLHPTEYRVLVRRAREQRVSVSLVARSVIADHFHYPAGVPLCTPDGKYQPRGFAKA